MFNLKVMKIQSQFLVFVIMVALRSVASFCAFVFKSFNYWLPLQDPVASRLAMELHLSWGLSELPDKEQPWSSMNTPGTKVLCLHYIFTCMLPEFSGKLVTFHWRTMLLVFCACQRLTYYSWSLLLGLASPTPTHPLTLTDWMMTL